MTNPILAPSQRPTHPTPHTMTNPITPPPELVASLRNSAPYGIQVAGVTRETREIWLINHAYAAGAEKAQALADQELEACCEWVRTTHFIGLDGHRALRLARRPEPLSLKERIAAAITDGDERTALSLLNEAMPNV